MRLNRFLSLCGLGSRRGTEEIVREGRVAINGQRVTDLATQVKEGDEVSVDGRRVVAKEGVVIVLHKPKGYLCTREDTHERSTIYDLLPKKFHNLHHVGRLDQDSEGLILLTNKGELSQRLLHPSEGVEKEYSVRLETQFDQADIPKLLNGVMTQEGFAKAERAWVENAYVLNVVLKQGLKRQIRLMFYGLGYEVERLIRTRIGGLKLYGLPKGDWRVLTEAEVERYFQKREARPKTLSKARPAKDSGDDHFAPSGPARAPRASKKTGTAARKPRRFSKDSEAGASPAPKYGKKPGSYSRPDETRAPAARKYAKKSEGYSRPDETRAPAARKYAKKSEGYARPDETRAPAARKYAKKSDDSATGRPASRKSTSTGSTAAKRKAASGWGKKHNDGKYHR